MGEKPFYSKRESAEMHVVLSHGNDQRIPFGRTHESKQLAEQAAALFSRGWAALAFAGVDLPGTPSFDD